MDQTPPEVSEDQLAKLVEVLRARIRKTGRNGLEFQYMLGHKDLVTRLDGVLGLADDFRRSLPLLERPPFLTVRVGTLKTESDLRQAVLDAGCRIGDWASDLMSQPAFTAGIAQAEEDVEFVIASNAELGYPNGCSKAQTCEAGLKLGWKLCLPSDAIEIRRNYLDQPVGEWFLVAMDSIAGSGGLLRVFDVVRDGGDRWLHGNDGRPGFVWGGRSRWAFRCK